MNIYIDRRISDKNKEKNMFNVTVLKMRDIKKYGIGIIATVTVVIAISKCCINVTKK